MNDSRTWGMMIDGFVSNLFADKKINEEELHQIKHRLIYRHIGWLYTHRSQLLEPTPWEHISQGGHTARTADSYQRKTGIGLVDYEASQTELSHFLSQEEKGRLSAKANTATQLINEQSRDLKALREQGILDDFRHMELANLLRSFYEHQGKNERIKKFPLPRQFANMSRYFVGIFTALLPFSMIQELMKVGDWGFGLSIPITALIGWVYTL